MRCSRFGPGCLIFAALIAVTIAPANQRGDRQPVAWCYVQKGPLELARKALQRKASSLSLGQGALAAVLKTESKNGGTRAMVRVTDLSTLDPVEAWVDSSQAEITPFKSFPSDQELLRQLGGEYRNEETESKVAVARWLVREGQSGTAMVCFIASVVLPASRLIAFLPAQGRFIRGPSLEFPFADMNPGILGGEVRDLLGDGNECFITREPFREGPGIVGVNMVIRRLEGGEFRTLWAAPLESRNLGSYPPKLQMLHPLERNAGAPGTVTKAEVEFQQAGKNYIPVWKGEVKFFAVGQDEPIDQVKVTKACAWNGVQFEPLR